MRRYSINNIKCLKGAQAENIMVQIKTIKCYFIPTNGDVAHYRVGQNTFPAVNCSRSRKKINRFEFILISDKWSSEIRVKYFNNRNSAFKQGRAEFPLKKFFTWLTACGVSLEGKKSLLKRLALAYKAKELGFTVY